MDTDHPGEIPSSRRVLPAAGDTLGFYRIDARIGAGGMGEVFRAVDTRLDRKVAIKVCTVRFSERFEREARTLSSLSHPHICTLFDVGPNYLVMELIEGETLSACVERGPLPIADVLRYGAQITDALAEAHRANIVHRDLKPQNVMVTRHGIKILDFGIARVVDETLLTSTGATVGTPAYMAPEQFEGNDAGARSDLFALGLVFYEMAAGQLPIPGTSLGKVLPGVGVGTVPSAKARNPEVPAALDALITNLLERDAAKRPASAIEVGDRLRRMAAAKDKPNASLWLAVAAMLFVVMAGGWWILRRNIQSPLQVARLSPFTTLPGLKLDPAYSPDGASLAMVWRGEKGDQPGIYVIRNSGEPPARVSSGATDISPAWSPDGKQIAFMRIHPGQANELMLVPPNGGPEKKLRDVRQPEILTRGRRPVLTWTRDGNAIVLPSQDADSGRTSLFRVGIDGSTPRRLIESTGGQGDTTPAFSGDGRWLAYSDFEAFGSQLYVLKMGPGETPEGTRQPIPGSLGGVSSPVWSPDGKRLIWANGSKLMEWETAGATRVLYTATDLFEGLTAMWKTNSVPQIVFANLGVSIELHQLILKDGGWKTEGPSAPLLRLAGNQTNPALSPDGRWLAFDTPGSSGNGEIWIADANGENPRRLSSIFAGAPISWSPDSRHIAFHARVPSIAQVYIVDVDENGKGGEPRQLTHSAFSLFGPVWSMDGSYLYVTGNRSPTAQRVLRIPAAGGELEDLFEGDSERTALDGHRILYAKSGQAGIFERSLDGDIASNPEQRVVEDYVPPLGFITAKAGIFYVGRDAARKPSALRFYDYSLKQSFDVAPPPSSAVPVFTLSSDGNRLVLERASQIAPSLTRMEFRLGN